MEMNVVKTTVMGISRQPSPIHIMIDQKQMDNVEYFNCVGSMLTKDARCTREMKSRIAMAKAIFKKKNLFTSKLDLKFREETSKCYMCSIRVALSDAETWKLRDVDQKCLGISEMLHWRRMKISLTDRVKDEEVLQKVNEELDITVN
jgi:hypothetical protein